MADFDSLTSDVAALAASVAAIQAAVDTLSSLVTSNLNESITDLSNNLSSQMGNPLQTGDYRLNNLDAPISQTEQASDSRLSFLDSYISNISVPTDILLSSDSRLNNLDAPISAIPTTPLLTDDARLNVLDAQISQVAGQVISYIPDISPLLRSDDTRLDNLNAPIGSIPTNPVTVDDARLSYLDLPLSSLEAYVLGAADARLNNLDAPISGVPTNPLLDNDPRLDNLDSKISSVANNFLASDDSRLTYLNNLQNLDYPVSGVPGQVAQFISFPTDYLNTSDSRLNNLDAPISSIPTNSLTTSDLGQLFKGYQKISNTLLPVLSGGMSEILVGPITLNATDLMFFNSDSTYFTIYATVLSGASVLYSDVSTQPYDNTEIEILPIDSSQNGFAKITFKNFPDVPEGIYKLILKGGNNIILPFYQDILVLNSEHYSDLPIEMANLLATKAIGTPDLSGIANSIAGLGSPLQTNDTRLNNLDAAISAIPTTTLLNDDSRLNNLDAPISGSTAPDISVLLRNDDTRLDNLDAHISSIPINPLLDTDSRLNNLDAPISNIPTDTLRRDDTRLDGLDMNLGTSFGDLQAAISTLLQTSDSRLDNLDAPISGISGGTGTVDLTGVMMSADSRLDNLDAPISAIPTTPMLAGDYVAPDNTSVGSILAKVNQFLDFSVGTIYAKVSALDFATAIGEYFGRPVNTKTLNIEVFLADDYYGSEGRAVEWKSTSWPDLTGRTVTFTCNNVAITGTIAVSGVDQVIAFNLSNANIALFGAGTHSFQVTVVLQNGHHITLLTGKLTAI